MLISQAIRDFLAADSTLVALLPEQSGFTDSTTSPQKKAASLFVRRPHQAAVRPFVLVRLPRDHDAGVTCDGDDERKIELVDIMVSTDADANSISAIESRIRSLIRTVNQVYIPSVNATGKIFVQSMIIQDRRFMDGPNVDGGEEGVGAWLLTYLVAYDEPVT